MSQSLIKDLWMSLKSTNLTLFLLNLMQENHLIIKIAHFNNND